MNASPTQPALEWQVAGACNYDCSYCIQSPRYRRGRPSADDLRAAIRCFARLPGTWEIKCSGGEAFAHPLFLDLAVPALMADTPHHISILSNLSAGEADLDRFLAMTRGRLRVVSASLHVEHVDPSAFADKVARMRDRADPDVRFVVNQVVLPGQVAAAAACRAIVEARGLRWFPQLFKHKILKQMRVAAYPDADALAALLGDRPGPQDANLSPSYRGRMCWAGAAYFVVDKDGQAWRCRSSKREDRVSIGSVFDDTLRLSDGPRPCAYSLCPCTVPANRGMISGVPAVGLSAVEEDA